MRLISPSFEVPHRLRAIVRARESSVIVLAALIGVAGGLVVVVMGQLVGVMHAIFFALEPGQRLSGVVALDPLHAFLVPCLDGLAFGLVSA